MTSTKRAERPPPLGLGCSLGRMHIGLLEGDKDQENGHCSSECLRKPTVAHRACCWPCGCKQHLRIKRLAKRISVRIEHSKSWGSVLKWVRKKDQGKEAWTQLNTCWPASQTEALFMRTNQGAWASAKTKRKGQNVTSKYVGICNEDICDKTNGHIVPHKTILPKRGFNLQLGNSLYKNFKSTHWNTELFWR